MKKLTIFIYMCLWFGFLFGNQIDIYKKGDIKLIPDRGFGKLTDWGFYLNKSKKFTVSSNGSVFIVDTRRSIISKFDKKGNFLLNFSKKGRGPGDLDRPGNISVLDEKYLVIGDYPPNQKISLFDLNGKFINVIKTNYPVYNCLGLKNNKIAILSKRRAYGRSNSIVISLLDIEKFKEKIIIDKMDHVRMIREPGLIIPAPDLQNNGFLRKLGNGSLLVGFSYDNFLSIFSPNGKKLKTIKLKIKKIEVTDKIVDEYKNNYINTSKQLNWEHSKSYLKSFKSCKTIKKLFSDYLPFLSNLFVDSEDNILVFKFTNNKFNKSPQFQVYSIEGNYICESKINFIKYDPIYIDNRFEGLIFRSNSLYMILNLDYIGVIAKIDLK